MTEENNCAKTEVKKKRELFRFKGSEDMTISLDHVHKITQKECKLTFQFSATADFVEFENEEAAKNAYEQILNIWSHEIKQSE